VKTPCDPVVRRVALAYCRPKMMKRIVHFLGQCRVSEIYFYRPFLSDKSYETSGFYSAVEVKEAYDLGLSQIRASQEFEVQFHSHFKPFLEDVLLKTFAANSILVTEPDARPWDAKKQTQAPEVVIFGPEKGFTERELLLMNEMGLDLRSFAPMHLRLESAVPFVFGKLTMPLSL
jgi:RsmE family RNA methyltransferase